MEGMMLSILSDMVTIPSNYNDGKQLMDLFLIIAGMMAIWKSSMIVKPLELEEVNFIGARSAMMSTIHPSKKW